MVWDTQPDPINMVNHSGESDVSLSEVIAANSTAGRTLADRFGEVINVKDFGAVGNGSTDDTAALQDAFDTAIDAVYATIVAPPGTYVHEGLVLAPSSGTISCNLLGLAGAHGVILNYVGGDGISFLISNNVRFIIENLLIRGIDGSGTREGLAVRSLTQGSNCGPGMYNNMAIYGFTTNLHLGTTSDLACSEQTFNQLDLQGATIQNVLIEEDAVNLNANTLNIVFNGLFMVNAPIGVKTVGLPGANGPTIHVNNGASALMGTHFLFTTPVQAHIQNYETEQPLEPATGTRIVQVGPDNATTGLSSAFASITLDHVVSGETKYKDDISCAFHWPGRYIIRNSQFANDDDGNQIQIGAGNNVKAGSLLVESSTINSKTSPPIAIHASNTSAWKVKLHSVQLATGYLLGSDTMADDREYIVRSNNTEFNILTPVFPLSLDYATINQAGQYSEGDTTPTVAGARFLAIVNSGGTTITNFDDGYAGQEVTLQFSDANTTIQDNANVQLAGGANFTSSANDTLTIIKVGSVWYEKCRSVN